jgi:hypothetical protein
VQQHAQPDQRHVDEDRHGRGEGFHRVERKKARIASMIPPGSELGHGA